VIPKLQGISLGGIEYMKNGAVCQGKKLQDITEDFEPVLQVANSKGNPVS
jgi:hypothetical protein